MISSVSVELLEWLTIFVFGGFEKGSGNLGVGVGLGGLEVDQGIQNLTCILHVNASQAFPIMKKST